MIFDSDSFNIFYKQFFLYYAQNVKLGKNATHQFAINKIRTIFCDDIPLTYKIGFPILTSNESKFLVRQEKLGESSWLRNQPDKVSRPSEPSFAFMQVTAWMKRKQDDRRP